MNEEKSEANPRRREIGMVHDELSRTNRDNLLMDSSTSNHIDSGDKNWHEYASSAEELADASKILLPQEAQLPLPHPNLVIMQAKSIVADTVHCHRKSVNRDPHKTSSSIDGELRENSSNCFHAKRIESIPKKLSNNDNVVTAATASSTSSEYQDTNIASTTTTSSSSGGDDDDRGFLLIQKIRVQTGNAIGNGNANCASSGTKPRSIGTRHDHDKGEVLLSSDLDAIPSRKKARYNQHDNHNQGSLSHTANVKTYPLNDDGSTLKVPGDDGSDRIVAGDVEGGVPLKPATVVASRLFTPPSSTIVHLATGNGDNGNGGKRKLPFESSTQNQHHLLLPPHREPGYHTIRNTLYRFHGNGSNGNDRNHSHRSNRSKKRRSRSAEKKFAKTNKVDTDPSSMDDVQKGSQKTKTSICINNRIHHGDRSSPSGSSRNTQNGKPNRKSDQSRSIRRSSTTGSKTSQSSEKRSSNFIEEENVGGSFSGSGTDGTEDGYAGSVSSNENGSGNQQLGSSSSSPSETSSEECDHQEGRLKSNRHRRVSSKQKSSQGVHEGGDLGSSSELADFSSGSSETMDEDDVRNRREVGSAQTFGMKEYSASLSPSFSSSNYSDSEGLELAFLSAKRDADAMHERMLKNTMRKKKSKKSDMRGRTPDSLTSHIASTKRLASKNLNESKPAILAMGCDVMAHILTFLHPPEILDVLTMPLSKCWRLNFTSQPEIWRVLCLVEPFKAIMVDPTTRSQSSGATDAKDRADSPHDGTNSVKNDKNTVKLLDKYRLLYTSFVRCMKYISQIRDDAINGRPPAYIDYGISGGIRSGPDMHSITNLKRTNNRESSGPPPPSSLGSNRNLQLFLAQARDVVVKSSTNGDTNSFGDQTKNDTIFPSLKTAARVGTAHRKDQQTKKKKNDGPKFGRSMITSRLYSPVQGSEPSNLNLPWSCAIYSIVNWMVAFSDVEGIQTLCLKVLPVLLENEQHRLTAQHAGLADVVLRDMVMFSESAQLHIAAFHTIVLLARPHGGSEGMMFRTSMTADGIFRGIYQRHGKSGIAVMLDSMRRFQDNATLLAMSCWALVNIALVSDQKAVLVKLGGIQAITNAMYRHPFSAELQFRALFALINLVIPSVQSPETNGSDNNRERPNPAASHPLEPEQLGELNETTQKEIIDELVRDIASLVVHVMKNFCSSEAILNRACLVLHNLSLTEEYHVILLWTPQCYQMLEWCVANYRSDQVLQQSATGTLHRLQSTLASDAEMRSRFSKSLRTQQQHVNLNQA